MAEITELAAEIEVGAKWRCVICTHHWFTPDPQCDCCKKEHCPGCGQVFNSTFEPKAWSGKCWCCGACSQWPCQCEPTPGDGSSKHFRQETPWELRGRTIGMIETDGPYETWVQAWPALEHNETIDICSSAADFYLLDALRHRVLNREHDCDQRPCTHAPVWEIDDGTKAVARMAQFCYEDHVQFLDTLFCQYVDMACGGELRHHPAVGSRTISGNRRSAWAGWRTVRSILGAQALMDMADLFYDWGKTGSTGYGGPLWAKAAELLYDRLTGRITPDQWVDRVFSLVHNGGVFLNKLGWGTTNKKGWNLSMLQQKVLPAHSMDQFNTLLGVASPEVVRLWDEYWRAQNKSRVRSGLRAVPNPRTFTRVRVICRYCSLNPKIGHKLSCSLYEGGHIPLKDSRQDYFSHVEEDDWNDYMWGDWEKSAELASVLPDGRIKLRPAEAVSVRVVFGRGLNMTEYIKTLNVTELMSLQVRAAEVFPQEYYRWASIADENLLPGFTWKIELYTANMNHKLGVMKSSQPIKSTEKFHGLIIDCGLMLPAGMPEIEWTEATAGYLASVIHA